MKKAYFIFIVYCLFYCQVSLSQVSQSVADYYSVQANERVMNYYSALNLICGNQLQNDEKGIIINETINEMFENEQVYVYNDVDLTNTTQTDFKIKDCLENIKLFYSNSEITFEVDFLKLSDIFEAKDFYFYKAEVTRKMIIVFNNQKKTDTKHLDFYIKFIPNKLNCQIYSIKNHEDNLSQFNKITIEGRKKEGVKSEDYSLTQLQKLIKEKYAEIENLYDSLKEIEILFTKEYILKHENEIITKVIELENIQNIKLVGNNEILKLNIRPEIAALLEVRKIKDELANYKTKSPYGKFRSDYYGNKYSGEYDMNNQRNGKGILIKSNGSIYAGEFNNGTFRSGSADETDNYGNKYTGQYNNYLREGIGILIKENGSKYEGAFSNGYFSTGKADESGSNSGDQYVGTYSNGVRNGKGRLIKANKCIYQGEFLNGNFWSGYADESDSYSGDDKYVGIYSNGIRNGKGKLIKANKCRYEGEFLNGNFWSGYAYEIDNYGKKFVGQYKNGQAVK